MSFHKIRILKKFKIKKKNNITVDIKPKLKSKSSGDNTNNIDLLTISDEHYIILLFSNNISVNRAHNMNWNDNKKIYLNMTNLYLKNGSQMPYIKLDKNLLKPGFKYKKYIRKYIQERYYISKKNIINIKLLETLGNIHSYLIILNNTKCLDNGISSINTLKPYSWRTILDFYNIFLDNDKPDQNKIYNFVCDYNKKKNHFQLNLKIDNDGLEEEYAKNYIYKYANLLNILGTINFKY